jgi:type I restriction enzyme M protein
MNLLLHGIEDFVSSAATRCATPSFTTRHRRAGHLRLRASPIPPFSLEQWGRELWEKRPVGPRLCRAAHRQQRRLAWVQHMVKSMAAGTGRMAVVLPQGALFRGGVEGRSAATCWRRPDRGGDRPGAQPVLRHRAGGLHPGAAPTQAGARGQGADRRCVVAFRKGRAQNFLEPEHGATILGWVQAFADVEDRARVVSLDEIKPPKTGRSTSRAMCCRPLGRTSRRWTRP